MQSPPPMGRPLPSYSLSKTLPKTPSPPFCCQDNVVCHGIALVSSDHLPGCVLSQLLVHAQSTHWGVGRVRNREGLATVQTLFSNS